MELDPSFRPSPFIAQQLVYAGAGGRFWVAAQRTHSAARCHRGSY
jgi:hypothetical protein